MPEYPRTPFRKVGTEIQPRVEDDELNMLGAYALQLQNIQDLAAKGAGYWFDGIDDVVQIPNDSNLNLLTGGGSIIVKFNNTGNDGAINSLFSIYDAVTEDGQIFRIDDNGRLFGVIYSSGAAPSVTGSTDIGADNKHHTAVFIMDRTSVTGLKLYLDGKEESYTAQSDPTAISGDIIASTAIAHIGMSWSGVGSPFAGMISRLYKFNLNLTEDEAIAFSNGAPVQYKYLDASQTNWVVNGGFETDIATPPNQWVNSGNQVGSSIADGTAPEGSNVLEIVSSGVGDNGANNVYSSPTGKTIMRKHYRLQFKAKSISGNTSLHAHRHTGAVILTGDWAEYTQEFVKTESGYTRGAYIWLEGVGVARVDDVRLTQIGCVAQYEQDGIGHNQWLDKSSNELHGTVSGALPTNLPADNVERFRHTDAMTNDTIFTDVVPTAYELEKIIFVESAGNAATLDLGTTATGEDVFEQQVIAASGITTIVLNKTFSMSATQSLYLNDDGAGTWNSASLTATLMMKRVI